MAWLAEWKNRKSKTINGTTAGIQTDYQMKITLHKGAGSDTGNDIYLGADVRDDFGDIRFTSEDGVSSLNYWIESIVPGIRAVVWVRINSIPASPGTTIIYLYFNNPSATSISSEANTFVAADLTTFTKVDPGSKLSVISPSKVTFSNLYRNQNIYLYKQISPISNYRYDFEYFISTGSSSPQNDGYIMMGGLADSPNNLWSTANNLNIRNYNAFHINQSRLYMESKISGTPSFIPPGDNYASIALGQLYYITITRVGTTVTMNVYSDAARTIHAAGSPRSGTVSQAIPFSYVLPVTALFDGNTVGWVSGYVQNARVRKYAAPEPVWGSTGTTESQPLITAASVVPSQTACVQPCNISVDITWVNNGGAPDTFEPAVIVDGVRTGLGTQIPLNPGQTVTQTFIISNLMKGAHTICPYPN